MDILEKNRLLHALWIAFKWPIIGYCVYFAIKVTLKPLFNAIVRALFK